MENAQIRETFIFEAEKKINKVYFIKVMSQIN